MSEAGKDDFSKPGVAEFPEIENTLAKLTAYCQANHWSGYDPYDALNSRWMQTLPVLDCRPVRLALTQLLKRSPVNLRAILRVPPSENPKALGLFLSAFVKLASQNWPGAREKVEHLVERLAKLSAKGEDVYCWGYGFAWQTRTVLVPRNSPNLVCTVFAANALLDAYEFTGAARCLQMAASATQHVHDELYWEEGNVAGFGYPTPTARTQVHNANLLGAALLCRTARHTGQTSLRDRAIKVARHSVSKQKTDGSWLYGEASRQGWVDNFHTGFNLSALRTIAGCAPTDEFETAIRRGFEFYRSHFFTPEGVARYFHNQTYPIDIHCVAQSLLTLTEFDHLNKDQAQMAGMVYRWAMKNMWNDAGFFYYRKLRGLTIRTSYMRWSQAWMLLALAAVVKSRRETPART
jgi:hypothetical protein